MALSTFSCFRINLTLLINKNIQVSFRRVRNGIPLLFFLWLKETNGYFGRGPGHRLNHAEYNFWLNASDAKH